MNYQQQTLNGLVNIEADEITTNTIDEENYYTNKNITMEYDILRNSVETFNITTTPTSLIINTNNLEYYYTFNNKDFNGLYLKNQTTGLHDAQLTNENMKEINYLHFTNDGNYLILPDISIGSNGFTFIITFSSNNSPNYAAVFELSNLGSFNQNITMYILYGNIYINIFY